MPNGESYPDDPRKHAGYLNPYENGSDNLVPGIKAYSKHHMFYHPSAAVLYSHHLYSLWLHCKVQFLALAQLCQLPGPGPVICLLVRMCYRHPHSPSLLSMAKKNLLSHGVKRLWVGIDYKELGRWTELACVFYILVYNLLYVYVYIFTIYNDLNLFPCLGVSDAFGILSTGIWSPRSSWEMWCGFCCKW